MTTTSVRLPHGGELTARQQSVLDAMRGQANVYVYGPPGTGKTMLLDGAHALNARSIRWHCAEFFRAVHSELPSHGRSMEATVASLTGKAGTVYFDEFHLHDVADSIYLDRALAWWAAHRVRVVATSNYRPAQLLPNPLLHDAAEPVIAQLSWHFAIFELDDGVDYRRGRSPVPSADSPASTAESAVIVGGREFTGFASGVWLQVAEHSPLTGVVRVNGRPLAVSTAHPAERERILETTFAALCDAPWSTSDYLELVSDHDQVVLHDVPDPGRLCRDPGQRLANLVDVAYDRDVPLVIYAEGAADRLVDAEFPPLDVARTVSRLAALRDSGGPSAAGVGMPVARS